MLVLLIILAVIGGGLYMLGMWGIDFANGAYQGGYNRLLKEIRRRDPGWEDPKPPFVYVPLIRKNFTGDDWFNLNWFLGWLGGLFMAVGWIILLV